jgi:hypothetical protein
MKNNTEQMKIFLQKALVNAPQDFSLSEVRYHLRVALTKLEDVEKKRERRDVASENRKEERAKKQQGFNPFATLQAIEEMISEEKAKLEEIQRRRNAPKDGTQDDDLQLLG